MIKIKKSSENLLKNTKFRTLSKKEAMRASITYHIIQEITKM
jgi:hypothetical protein